MFASAIFSICFIATAEYQQTDVADVQGKGYSWGNANQSENIFQIIQSGITDAGRATIKKAKEMNQIGNSNEDMLALLEAVVGIKNELLYIREYFHPLLKGKIVSVLPSTSCLANFLVLALRV